MQPISSAGNHVTRVLTACTIGLAALSSGVSSRAWAQTATPSQVMTWKIDGETREAIVYAPASAAGRMPLVFSFHGRGDNTENFQHTDLHLAWPDAIVVYPQGLSTLGRLSGWQVERGESDDRDLKLLDAMLGSLRAKYSIDANRVYATGFSNGAMFTYLLWAERPDVFAAYAPVAGRLRASVQPKQRRPLLHVAGQRDPQVTFEDQKAAMEIAIDVNGVRDKTKKCGDGCTLYGGDTPAPVMTWIHPGGHTYPRGTAELIAKFFRDHPRKR